MKRSLAEVITKAIDVRQAELRICMPGTVIAYYAATQTADIQPPIWSALDLEDGVLQEQLPVLFNVPVEFPRGGGYAITFPLLPGDTGELRFSDFSMDLWRSSGLDGPPQDLRTHALGSAVFQPGLASTLRAIPGLPNALFVGSETGLLPVVLGATTATDFVALASLVLGELQKIQSAFSGHTHVITAQPTTCPAGAGTCTGTTATGPAYTPASVASTVVKSV